MYDLIVMTFDDREDVEQIRFIMRQFLENGEHDFDASIVAKDHDGKLLLFPLKETDTQDRSRSASSAITISEKMPDKAFVQDVLDSLPLGGAALFVLVDDDESSTALLTILMLFSPNAMPFFTPDGMSQHGTADAYFHADLETYQAAVANLEDLRSDSTEGDVEIVFKAVDEAYDRLLRFIYTEPVTEDA
jgi:hypothetical protein